MPLARSTLLAAGALASLCFQTSVFAQSQEKPPTSTSTSTPPAPAPPPATSSSAVTVTSLIGQGYEIKAASVTTKILGIVMQNGKNVYVCLADILDRPRTTHCGKVQ